MRSRLLLSLFLLAPLYGSASPAEASPRGKVTKRGTSAQTRVKTTRAANNKRVTRELRRVGDHHWLSTSSGYYVAEPYPIRSLSLGEVYWAQAKEMGALGVVKRQAKRWTTESEHLSRGARRVSDTFASRYGIENLGPNDRAEVLFGWGFGKYMPFQITVTRGDTTTSVRGTWNTVHNTVSFGDNAQF